MAGGRGLCSPRSGQNDCHGPAGRCHPAPRRWALALVPLVSVLTATSSLVDGPAGCGANGRPCLRRRRHDRVRRRRGAGRPELPQPLDSPVDVGAVTPDGKGYWLSVPTAACSRPVTPPSKDLWATRRCRARSWAWRPPPTARATGWPGRTAGSSLSARMRRLLGEHGRDQAQPADRGHGGPTPDGKGYWVVAADGGIFSFGDAPFFGQHGRYLSFEPALITGMAATPTATATGWWRRTAASSRSAMLVTSGQPTRISPIRS